MKDLVSIIMLARNKERFIEPSIRSIMAQTYQNWELLFVDDASEDDTVTLLMKLSEEDRKRGRMSETKGLLEDGTAIDRIQVTKTIDSRGEACNRNLALRNAKGRWIAFLDAGDIWEPTKLEKQIQFMESNNYTFSYTTYRCIDMNMRDLGVVVAGPEQINYHEMLKCCWMGYQTVMYDSTKIGLLQVSCMATVNDYALWLQAAQKADCHLLPECLASQMVGKSLWHRLLTSDKWTWRYRTYRIVDGRNPITATYMTLRNMVYAIGKYRRYVSRINND